MDDWRLHWLEAAGDLSPWRDTVEREIAAAKEALAGLVAPPRLDILVERLANAVIPEIGMVGRAYRPTLFSLTLDPDNAQFGTALTDGTLQRQVVHEAHHCLRMAGPGYGRTLGEALVSEGLAGQFVRRIFGNPPEPWECAVDDATVAAHLPDRAALTAAQYDHFAWFYGRGGRYPRWLGYTAGYRIAGAWLAQAGDVDGATLVSASAETVLAVGIPDMA